MVLPFSLPHWQSPCGRIILFNCHYEELFKVFPDLCFDLLCADPPYGIDAGNVLTGPQRKSGNGLAKKSAFRKSDWDKEIPPAEYFTEAWRTTKDQIIWGANYMVEHLPNSSGWIIWDKNNGTTNFADAELAFTSFDVAVRIFKFTWNGMLQGDMNNKEIRIHPTQKPVQLYKWCMINYAEPGFKILDTHIGSGNIAIAIDGLNKVEGMNLTLIGCEIDPLTFKDAIDNIIYKTSQIVDYNQVEPKTIESFQQKLFDTE